MRIGIDVGGTFTDVAWLRDGAVVVHKVPTTPDDQSRAILTALDTLGVAVTTPVVHGMTVATNALLERRGARTALITTKGFADVLVLGRQHRPALYAFTQTRPAPLVPTERRFEVTERLDVGGAVVTPLEPAQAKALVEPLRAARAESVAVVLLHSYQHPAHEQAIAEALRRHLPGVDLSLSSELLPEHREYERTATTTINAYVQPLVARYLARLEEALHPRPLRIMQSNGGVAEAAQAAQQAARLVLSGPAGGVVGAFRVAQQALADDAPSVLTFDMGGTSTDVALCPGAIPRTAEGSIADLPLRLPSTDIHTVGAGGGSIARVDAGGVLRVGPESAGALPGPACYGHGGTAPTVTDANVVLGRLDPDGFLDGRPDALRLDPAAARAALKPLAKALDRSVEAAALGVLRVANAAMERALRRVSVERGYDPRGAVLVPFGGAGPLHACALAEALSLRRVLLPRYPGVLSALGLLQADTVADRAQALLRPAQPLLADPAPLASALHDLHAHLDDTLGASASTEQQRHAALDLRYAGQSYELTVPMPSGQDLSARLRATLDAFHEAHTQRYGYATPDAPVEVVSVRLHAQIPAPPWPLTPQPTATAPLVSALLTTKPVWFTPDAPTPTPHYDRARLQPGHTLTGPALLLQYDTTTVLPPGWTARVDPWTHLLLEHSP
ncbi:MAG: hydantoinase/oxoprolinase family protein [Bacteroidota bacterium]